MGAVAGPRTILDRMRWGSNMVLHYGTFNGHRLTMSVIAANLDLLAANEGAVYQQIYEVGDAAVAGLRDVFHRRKIDAVVQGFGPMFQIYFTGREAIHDYRDYCQLRRYVKVLALRPRAARSWHLHDAFERIALDYFDSTHHDRTSKHYSLAADEVCAEMA
jgi:glutamate-1-semialdehyde aminotransferase